jgi:NAD(P)-dependent dehydrogenase (short-subunit alcohol dehydrogenase family)
MFSETDLNRIAVEFPANLFQDSTALVTGAQAGGIGEATAALVASLGAKVVLIAQAEEVAILTARRLDEIGIKVAAALGVDFSEPIDVVRFGAALVENNQIDLLFNVAGITPSESTPLAKGSVDADTRILDINLRSPIELTRVVVNSMLAAPKPNRRIFFVTSAHAVSPIDGYINYAITKAGLEVATRGLASELAPEGIGVFALRAGFVVVDRHSKSTVAKVKKKVPTALTTPLQIAAAMVRHCLPSAFPQSGSVIDFSTLQIGTRRS